MTSYSPVKIAFYSVEPENYEHEKAPIIFLHGMSTSKERWNDIPKIIANATKRKTYALDARNHGDSDWCDIFDFEGNSYDLFHFMDSINASKAIIVGHSMGGTTGIKAALQKPERIEKLIVEDMSVTEFSQESLDLMKLSLNALLASILHVPHDVDEATARQMISHFVHQKNLKERKGDTRHLTPPPTTSFVLKRTADGRYAFKANLDAMEKALQTPQKLLLRNSGVYEGPAYFLYGKLSTVQVQSDECHIKQFFPNAELICFENATHTVHDDCPEQFNKILMKCILN